jgi:hypothetical protein
MALAERAGTLARALVAADPALASRPALIRMRDDLASIEEEGGAA